VQVTIASDLIGCPYLCCSALTVLLDSFTCSYSSRVGNPMATKRSDHFLTLAERASSLNPMSTINHIDPAYFIANSMMYSIAFPFADTNQLFVRFCSLKLLHWHGCATRGLLSRHKTRWSQTLVYFLSPHTQGSWPASTNLWRGNPTSNFVHSMQWIDESCYGRIE